MHAAGVANPTSPLQQRIAVQHLAPKAATRRTNALAVSRYGREVEHEQKTSSGFLPRRMKLTRLRWWSLQSIHSKPRWLAPRSCELTDRRNHGSISLTTHNFSRQRSCQQRWWTLHAEADRGTVPGGDTPRRQLHVCAQSARVTHAVARAIAFRPASRA
jgi:hypothetical protein